LQLQVELEVSGRNFLPCAQAHAVPELWTLGNSVEFSNLFSFFFTGT
jgi:hypothetical protein